MKKATKKTTIRIAICAMIVTLASTLLVACGGGLSGTYYSADGLQAFTFNGDNVTMSAFGVNANGKYKIEGDKIIITYSLFGMEYNWSQPYSESDGSIYIGGTQFSK